MAPDRSSLDAALKLTKPTGWPLLASDADTTLVWGECQGSGATPYRVNVAIADMGYKCTCPSRKFPCKHVLAILLMGTDQPARFAKAEPPEWVRDWLARRRKSTTSARPQPEKQPSATDAAPPQLEGTAPAAPPPDPAKLEAQRRRQREARETKIAEGLDEFEQWLRDQLNAGLGEFAQTCADRCRTAARRLTDAQAQGIASIIDHIPGDVLKLRPESRADFIVEQLGLAHLLAQAYRKQADLPDGLRSDVRRAIGWSVKRDELIADAAAPRASGRWLIWGTRSILQADALRRLETWLMRSDGDGDDAGRFACLMDFVPASMGGAGSSFYAGEEIEADVVYYPSARPLRAVLAGHKSLPPSGAAAKGKQSVASALDDWDAAIGHQPFIHEWPLAVANGRIVAQHDGLALVDAASPYALALSDAQLETAAPLLGLKDLAALGLWNGRSFTLMMAETPIGRWVAP